MQIYKILSLLCVVIIIAALKGQCIGIEAMQLPIISLAVK